MKYLVLLFILFASVSYAGEQTITFEWDVNQEISVPGYNLYSSSVSADGPWEVVNDAIIEDTPYSYTYTTGVEAHLWFYIVATDGRNESEPSNVVDCLVDTVPPPAVQNLQVTSD